MSDCQLDPVRVREAPRADVDLLKRRTVYDKVPKQRCRDLTGREPIKVRWVDTIKQDEVIPKYRSRLAAKYFRRDQTQTCIQQHHQKTLRLLIPLVATGYSSSGARRRIMINGVARAYFNAPFLSSTVEICEEDFQEGDEDRCGELRASMYGTRPASQNWQRCYAELLVNNCFMVTRACTCIMRHDMKDLDLLAHGDDFVSVADEQK